MQLMVLLPTEVLINQPVRKVSAESPLGCFCLLPRHIDYCTALVPGLLGFESVEGEEVFWAIDEGLLVKCGDQVRVSTRMAIKGRDLATLKQAVEQQFRQLDEQERETRSALAKLEASLARLFMDL